MGYGSIGSYRRVIRLLREEEMIQTFDTDVRERGHASRMRLGNDFMADILRLGERLG